MARSQIVSRTAAFLISASVLAALSVRTASADVDSELLAASVAGDAAQVGILLNGGADADTRNERGFTPLIAATAYGHADVARALIEASATIEARGPNGNTALLIAAQEGHADIAALLIAHGADTKARNDHGGTAISFASGWGHRDIVTQLREAQPIEDVGSPTMPTVAFVIGLIAVVGLPMLTVSSLRSGESFSPAQIELFAANELAHKL